MRPDDPFARYLELWDIVPDGEVISTQYNALLPVCRDGRKLMLKVALAEEERCGGILLAEWPDGPFAQVLAQADDGVLMARAHEGGGLAEMAGTDDMSAAKIICQVAEKIHNSPHPSGLEPLEARFRDLLQAPSDPAFAAGQTHAKYLFENACAPVPLHGDLHHGNVLFFGAEGWKAIDPKGVWGERGFDYANMFCNPTPELALKPGRFEAQLATISEAAKIYPTRLCRWVVAWTGLSAVWSIQGGNDPKPALEIGEIAGSILRG